VGVNRWNGIKRARGSERKEKRRKKLLAEDHPRKA
jgi:hypothetical protein